MDINEIEKAVKEVEKKCAELGELEKKFNALLWPAGIVECPTCNVRTRVPMPWLPSELVGRRPALASPAEAAIGKAVCASCKKMVEPQKKILLQDDNTVEIENLHEKILKIKGNIKKPQALDAVRADIDELAGNINERIKLAHTPVAQFKRAREIVDATSPKIQSAPEEAYAGFQEAKTIFTETMRQAINMSDGELGKKCKESLATVEDYLGSSCYSSAIAKRKTGKEFCDVSEFDSAETAFKEAMAWGEKAKTHLDKPEEVKKVEQLLEEIKKWKAACERGKDGVQIDNWIADSKILRTTAEKADSSVALGSLGAANNLLVNALTKVTQWGGPLIMPESVMISNQWALVDKTDELNRNISEITESIKKISSSTTQSVQKSRYVFELPIFTARHAVSFRDYVEMQEINSSLMATVYKAKKSDGTLRALKFFKGEIGEDYRKRFKCEAEIMSALKKVIPDDIVVINDLVQDDEKHLFFEMEYVDGKNLFQFMRDTSQPLAPLVATSIALGCSSALLRIHNKGIVHRDIKPENIMVIGGNSCGVPNSEINQSNSCRSALKVKIADFGLARVLDGSGIVVSVPHLTELGAANIGTPGYMSPEQKSNFHGADEKADVFSLTVVLCEMLTGLSPNLDGKMWEHYRDKIQALKIPLIAAICLDGLVADSGKRPTMLAFHEALEKIQKELSKP